MKSTIERALHPDLWSNRSRIVLLICGVVAFIFLVQLVTANGVVTLLAAAALPLVAASVAGRWLKLEFDRMLSIAAAIILAAGVIAAVAPATRGLAELLITIGIVLLLYSVVAATHVAAFATRAYRGLRDLDYRRTITVTYVLLGLACASLFFAALFNPALWGLTYEFNAKVLIAVDSVAGAAFVYLMLGAFTGSRLARICGALAWIAAGARLGPNLIHFTPTFFLPAFGYAIFRLRQPGRMWLAIAIPLLTAIVAPAALLGLAIVAIAAYLALRSDPSARRVASAGLASVVAGGLLAVVAPSVFAAPNTIVSAALDGRLRDLSGDGAWPWEVLFPSLTGYFGQLATTLYLATGHYGNTLLVNAAIGESVVVGTFLAYVRRRSLRGLFPQFVWALLVLGLFFGLPSRIGSVPLPTFAALISILRPGIVLVPAATASLALAGAVALATIVDYLLESRANLSLALVLLLLAAQLFPNSRLFVPASSLSLSVAQWMSENGGGTLLPSRNEDDPWAIYGRYTLAHTGSHNVGMATLPPLAGLSYESGRSGGCYFAINYAAYRGFDAQQMQQFISVPRDTLSDVAIQPLMTVSGHTLKRISGDVAVYSRCR
jgi:hypothetical protein